MEVRGIATFLFGVVKWIVSRMAAFGEPSIHRRPPTGMSVVLGTALSLSDRPVRTAVRRSFGWSAGRVRPDETGAALCSSAARGG